MSYYFFLTREAIIQVNQMLNLPASGKEQDWELELANPDRIEEFLQLLISNRLSRLPDVEAAVAALFISSADEAISKGTFSKQDNDKSFAFFRSKHELRNNMFALWFSVGEPTNAEQIRYWLE